MNYDVVDKAEQTMRSLQKPDRWGKMSIPLTTSQIRKFLTTVNLLKNKVDIYKLSYYREKQQNPTAMSEDLAVELKFLRVNLLYQASREQKTTNIKDFIEKADLEKIITSIGTDINAFYKFCKYAEALVAFHKFYGGVDK